MSTSSQPWMVYGAAFVYWQHSALAMQLGADVMYIANRKVLAKAE